MKTILAGALALTMAAGSASAWSVNTPGVISQAPSINGTVITGTMVAKAAVAAFVLYKFTPVGCMITGTNCPNS